MIEAPISDILAQNLRRTAIDSTASIDTRLRNLYQYIENDVLGNIHSRMLEISPYKVCMRCSASEVVTLTHQKLHGCYCQAHHLLMDIK